MKGFQEFMLHPQRLDAILATIERARERIYGPLPRRPPRGSSVTRERASRDIAPRGHGRRRSCSRPPALLFALFVVYPIFASIRAVAVRLERRRRDDVRRARQLSRARSPTPCSATRARATTCAGSPATSWRRSPGLRSRCCCNRAASGMRARALALLHAVRREPGRRRPRVRLVLQHALRPAQRDPREHRRWPPSRRSTARRGRSTR